MRILSRADVQQSISMREAIEIVQDAFTQLSNGEATVPLRTPIPIPRHAGANLFMPAYLARSDALGIKIVSIRNDNPNRGLPLIQAIVALIDPATGRTLALMDGEYLTALRTGAGAGAATDVMARRDAHVAAIFGAGVQARTQLLAVAAVRDLRRVYIYNRTRDKAEALIQGLRGRDGVPEDVRIASSPTEAVQEADIICTATTSSTPVYDGNEVKPGAHVNGVGSYTREMQENDERLIQRASKIIVDAYSGALAEAGDLIIPLDKGVIRESDIYAELGEITGGKKPGRESPDEITFFKSVGNAVQDVSVAQAVLRAAEKMELGIEVDL